MSLKPCPRCGKMISDKAERCPQCGLDVKIYNHAEAVPDQQNISSHTIIESHSQQGKPTLIEKPYQYDYSTIIEPPKKSKTGLWICLCIILIVGIGVAIWIPVYRHKEKQKTEELALMEQQRLDSIAAVEAELARLEQIRQDSIKDEEAHRIHPKIFKYGGFSKLKSLGFKKVDEKHKYFDDGPDYEYIKYERVFNGRKTIYEYEGYGSSGSYLTFENKGDKDLFLKELTELGYKKSGNSYEHSNFDYPPMRIEGNKIFIATDY